MEDQKRGDDAADHAPKPGQDPTSRQSSTSNQEGKSKGAESGTQDAPNYKDETDGGRALKREDVNSANDA